MWSFILYVVCICMYVVFCKIDHCIHIHWCIVMGLGHNDPWVELHMWPQQTWGQRSSRGQWPLVQVFGKKGQCIHILWCIFKSNILQWMQKNVIAKAGETRGSRTALFMYTAYCHLSEPINFLLGPVQWITMLDTLTCSSVTSPISQEGQSERNFPIFAFSSRFFLIFFPDFSWFFPSFWHFFFCCQGWHSAPRHPVATPLLYLNYIDGIEQQTNKVSGW